MAKTKVLLVDDSMSARFALSKSLEKHDLDIETAKSAEEALGMLQNMRPDAIFMDHVLPAMNGLDAVGEIRKDPNLQGVPVIMCSSNDGDDYRAQAKEKGANHVIRKPPDPAQLDDIMQSVFSQATTENAAVTDQQSPANIDMSGLDERIAKLEQLLAKIDAASARLEQQADRVAAKIADQAGKELGNRMLRAFIAMRGK